MKRLALLVLLTVVVPALPSHAHPLGNYSTNLHLGIEVVADELSVLLVVDMAEVPTFREPLDLDGDSLVSIDELASYARKACVGYGSSIHLTTDVGRDIVLDPAAGSAALSPGAGGLETLRIECPYAAAVPDATSTISVSNRVHGERSGWAEIVVVGARADEVGAVSPSATLTAYPDSTPLAQREATITLGAEPDMVLPATEPASTAIIGTLGTLAGGGGLLAVVGALGLGVTHALAPGHGKTLMAAYLVGRRGTAAQAAGLGMATAVSHTIGVAILGIITATASSWFRPEQVYPWLTTVSAAAVTAVGCFLLLRALRGHHHDHDHHHHGHPHGVDRSHAQTGIVGWRSLAALGLAGGLVPSASAVVLLLGAVAIGRPWFGLLLVASFGIGMSVALVTVGIAALKLTENGLHRLGRRLVVKPQLVSAVAGLAVTTLGVFLLWDATRTLIG